MEMLFYCLNNGENYQKHRDEISPEQLQEVRDFLQGGEFDVLESRAVLSVSPMDEILIVNLWGKGKNKRYPLTLTHIAPTEFAERIAWPEIQRLHMNIMDLPLMRSLDCESPRKPKRRPWCAWINVCRIETIDHHPFALQLRESLAWAWYEHVINGPPRP